MSELKLILLCGNRIALPVMRDLAFHKQLAAVIIPENCAVFAQEVELLLKSSGIAVLIVTKQNFVSQLQRAIKKYDASIGLMVTFSYKLPREVFNLPKKGFFNVHPGPLPGYRGPDPVFWQIKNKEKYAGAVIHKVDDSFDTGPIVLSEKIRLSVTDTYGILTTKLSELIAGMAGTLMKMAGFDIAIPSRVQLTENAFYYKKQSADDISISWKNMDADTIVSLVNACNPWNKGAVTKFNNKVIRVLVAEKIEPNTRYPIPLLPGKVLEIDGEGVTVSAAYNSIVKIKFVFIDEGFLTACVLKGYGAVEGSFFQEFKA